MRTTETQGIRTARKFLGPFAGHSENVRYEGSAVDLRPVVTSCSNNRRENIGVFFEFLGQVRLQVPIKKILAEPGRILSVVK